MSFLEQGQRQIQRLEWDRQTRAGGFAFVPQTLTYRAAQLARPATIDDVVFFAGRGLDASHAALVLSHYFHIDSTAGEHPLPLVEAVRHVEERGAAGEFLLVGHPDGGLISVCRDRLAFQDGLEPITWWGP